jgi:hypothetical protein
MRTFELERPPPGKARRKEPGQEAWDCGENEDSPLRSHRLRQSARGPSSPSSFDSPEVQQLRFDAAGTTAGVMSPPVRVHEARILANASFDSFKDPSFRDN